MPDLRLIGVHEDGEHLLLTDDGTRYLLLIDDALRAAIRRPSTAQAAATASLSAREVQSLIRGGVSAEEVAERAGWSAAKVAVFSTPVLAERAHIAGRARDSRLRTRGERTGPERLHTRVDRRLTGRGVIAGDAEWDATRAEGGAWHVHVVFIAGGRARRASWRYDAGADVAEALDDEARWLSEDEVADGPVPAPHRFAGERVFDVEAVGGVTEADGPDGVGTARPDQTDALMTAIREHSHASERRGARRPARPRGGRDVGRRLATVTDGMSGTVEGATPADALAAHLAEELLPAQVQEQLPQAVAHAAPAAPPAGPEPDAPAAPPAGPEPDELVGFDSVNDEPTGRSDDAPDESSAPIDEAAADQAGEADPPDSDEIPPPAPGPHPMDPAAQDTSVVEQVADASAEESAQEPAGDGAASAQATATEPPPPPSPSPGSKRKGRVAVPDWNDVMFGPSRDDS